MIFDEKWFELYPVLCGFIVLRTRLDWIVDERRFDRRVGFESGRGEKDPECAEAFPRTTIG